MEKSYQLWQNQQLKLESRTMLAEYQLTSLDAAMQVQLRKNENLERLLTAANQQLNESKSNVN
jgi:hypothetical protein